MLEVGHVGVQQGGAPSLAVAHVCEQQGCLAGLFFCYQGSFALGGAHLRHTCTPPRAFCRLLSAAAADCLPPPTPSPLAAPSPSPSPPPSPRSPGPDGTRGASSTLRTIASSSLVATCRAYAISTIHEGWCHARLLLAGLFRFLAGLFCCQQGSFAGSGANLSANPHHQALHKSLE